MKRLKFKANLAEVKAKLKKHASPILTGTVGVIAVGSTYLAMRYRNELVRLQEDEHDWPCIQISRGALERVMEGATLLLRMYHDDRGKFVQFTTGDKFPDEADEDYNKGTPGSGE